MAGARKGPGGAQAARAGGHGSHWLSGLACGALLAFATGLALLLAVLLAPACVAAVMETAPGRPITRAMMLCASGFLLGPLWRAGLAGGGMAAALDVLSDPMVIGAAWLAGLAGWALCEVLPVLLRIAGDVRAAARINALQAEEAMLRAEWDLQGE